MHFDSVYIDLEKFERKGTIQLQNNLGTTTLYKGEEEQTNHIKRWFDLDQKSVYDKFTIIIKGDASKGWYQFNSIKFREREEKE